MGVKQPLHYRHPQFEHAFHQGGTHTNGGSDVWQTIVDWQNKRGTMFVRMVCYAGNAWVYLRVTIDGVAYPIYWKTKASGNCPTWVFDFNKSVKIESRNQTASTVLTFYGYNTWRP